MNEWVQLIGNAIAPVLVVAIAAAANFENIEVII